MLLHDGVRPFINEKTINKCIEISLAKGNAVTISPAIETIGTVEKNVINNFYPREKCILARAPQCFYLFQLLENHEKRIKNKESFVDSASMMLKNHIQLNFIEGPAENIKITTQTDFIFCKALIEENNNE